MKHLLHPACRSLAAVAPLLLLLALWWPRATQPSSDPAAPPGGAPPTLATVPLAETSPAAPSPTPADPATWQIVATKVKTDARARALAGDQLPPDFLDRIVDGESVSFRLPDGRTAAGSVGMIDRDAKGVLFVQGRLAEPAPGAYFLQRQTAEGVAGPFVGNVRFDGSQDGWKLEPTPDLKAARFVPRKLDEIICANYEKLPATAAGDIEQVPQSHPTGIAIPPYQTIIPLQSLPGAVGVIYLDFDGEQGPFPGWGDFNAAPANANNSQIFDVWKMVCEDYQGFNLNITTDRKVFDNAPPGRRQHVIISPTTNAAPGAGGVAYVGSYNWAESRPCWAFYATGKSSCEVISHEVGHTLGLSHDGRTTPDETYYAGHGSGAVGWAPIMGVGYSKPLTQWSKGEYLSANRTQDDLGIITGNNNEVDYRADDSGDSLATAKYLEIAANNSVANEGIIERTGDIDSFRFTTSGGTATLNVNTVASNPNLDILAEIVNATDATVVASDNPDTAINASVSANLPAGEYLLRVRGTGRGDPLGDGYTNYGCLGSYIISGTVAGGGKPDRFSIAENAAGGTAVGTVAARTNHGANPVSWAIASGNTGGAFAINPASGAITVASPAAIDYEALSLRWDDPATFELFVTITDGFDPALNETIRTVVTVTNVNEAPVMAGASITMLEHTRAGSLVATMNATDGDRFDFATYSITAGNAAGVFAIDSATGRLTVAASPDVTATTVYNLTVTATDRGSPALVTTANVAISVVNIAAGYEPGRIVRTYFENIGSGNSVADLTGNAKFPNNPDSEQYLAAFDGLAHGDRFGSTIRGYLIPPATGSYRFWIASDDASQLRFNATGAAPGGATQIAYVSGYTSQYAWTANASQQSATFNLTAGQPYYIEARHKEGGGGDHLAVAWTGPGIATRQVIPGAFLAPFYQNYAPKPNAATLTVRENALAGLTVGSVTVSDVNAGDTSSNYAITGGDPAGIFGIDSASGRIFVARGGLLDAASTPSHSLTIRTTDNGTPALDGTGTVSVSVLAPDVIASGALVQQIWSGISGTAIGNLTGNANYPYRPSYTRSLTDGFDSGTNFEDNYGSRIRAYVTPPITGSYTFFLTTDDEGQLRLSTSSSPTRATTIASITGGWAPAGNWTKYGSQKSAAVTLTAGQKYYIETLQKEGGGGDHVQVGWTGPGYATTTIIPASALQPFDINSAPSFSPASYAFTANDTDPTGTALGSVSASDPEGETPVYAITSGNAAGAFAIGTDNGTLTVADSAALAVGIHTLKVSAQDRGISGVYPLKSAAATVTLTVLGVNRPPVWSATTLTLPSIPEGQAYSATLAGTATDPDVGIGDNVSYTKISGPAWLSVAPDGGLSGNPSNPDLGVNTFTIRASDTYNGSADATLTITVANVAPVATPAAYACGVNGSISRTAVASDVGTTVLGYSLTRAPAHGSLAIHSGTGAFTYTPAAGWSGADSFTFMANDGGLDSNVALVALSVFDPTPPPTTYQGEVAASGPAAWWRVDETTGSTATDAIGANHGTYTQAIDGGYTLGQAGALSGDSLNRAVALDSLGKGHIMVPAVDAALQFAGSQAFSLEAWVRQSASGTNDPVFHRGAGSTTSLYRLFLNNGNLVFEVRNSSGTATTVTSATTLAPDTWHHVVAVCTPNGGADSIKLYINGIRDANSGTAPASLYQPLDASLAIGMYNRSTSSLVRYFTGLLDEPAIYQKALSAAEISNHYAARAAVPPPAVVLTAPAAGSHLPAPGNLTASADVTANGTTVSKVSFHDGGTLLGEVSTAPYALDLTGLPAASYLLTARVTYNSTLTIDSAPLWFAVDPAPVVNDLALSAVDHAPIAGVLTGSSPANGFALSFTALTQPAHGTLTLDSASGAFTYSPDAGWFGPDSFTFKGNDSVTDSNTGSVTLTVSQPRWINPAGGTWTSAGNWLADTVANGPAAAADFSTLDLTADATVTLDAARSIGGLIFGDTTPSHDWTLETGTSGPLTLDSAAGTPRIAVTNRTATLGAVLAGSQGLVKTGAGTLALAAANPLSGDITVAQGTLLISNNSAAGAVTVQADASLGGSGIIAAPVTIHGTLAPGDTTIGHLTIDHTLTLAAGCAIAWEITDWTGAAGTGYDVTAVASLDLTATAASPVIIRLLPAALANFTETSGTFTLIHTTSGITGFSADRFTIDASALTTPQGTWAVQQSGPDLVLAYTRVSPDANGNGILDTWESEHFGNADPGANPPAADADHDGITNLMEYALDSDPLVANASPLAWDLVPLADGRHLRLTVPKNPVATNLTYTVETCGSLDDWSHVATFIEADSATELVVRDTFTTATAPRRFIRLRVTANP